MRGEVCLGRGGLWGKVSGGEGEREERTYTPLGTLPLDNVEVNPQQLWPERIFGLPEVGVD